MPPKNVCADQRSIGLGNLNVCAPPNYICATYTKTTPQTITHGHVCASVSNIDISVNSTIQFKK